MNDLTALVSPCGLSLREQEILEQVAVGQSDKQVARSLVISPRTVERHIENIRLKMRARNTPHLISRAFLIGVLRLP